MQATLQVQCIQIHLWRYWQPTMLQHMFKHAHAVQSCSAGVLSAPFVMTAQGTTDVVLRIVWDMRRNAAGWCQAMRTASWSCPLSSSWTSSSVTPCFKRPCRSTPHMMICCLHAGRCQSHDSCHSACIRCQSCVVVFSSC
jgi:hypothetical protein